MIGRRSFLKLLSIGAAGLVLDPERALWVPGRITTFDLGAAPAFDPQIIDGILKDVYMPLVMEQLNQPSFLLFSSIKTRDVYRELVSPDERYRVRAPASFADTYGALERV